jgi:hypothetical protein
MAKAAKNPTSASIDRVLLANIAQEKVQFVSKSEGEALLMHIPPLIEVNLAMTDPVDATKVRCRITSAGASFLTNHVNPLNDVQDKEKLVVSNFGIIDGAVLPVSKRGGGGGGAPIKYPFDQLQVGQSFFVPATAKLPNPLKTLGSTISSANIRYADKIGEKEVTRAKRGKKNKLVLDANGQKIMETKTVPEYKFNRKFSIRGVEAGKSYGNWTAEASGALIQRVE